MVEVVLLMEEILHQLIGIVYPIVPSRWLARFLPSTVAIIVRNSSSSCCGYNSGIYLTKKSGIRSQMAEEKTQNLIPSSDTTPVVFQLYEPTITSLKLTVRRQFAPENRPGPQ